MVSLCSGIGGALGLKPSAPSPQQAYASALANARATASVANKSFALAAPARKVVAAAPKVSNVGSRVGTGVSNVGTRVGTGYSAPVRAAAPAAPAPPAYSGPSASGGSYSGGGGGIAFDATPPPPTTIDVPDPLADAPYQRQIGELARNMADFQAQQGLAKGQYEGQYNQGLHRMGWDTQKGNPSGFAGQPIGDNGGWSRAMPGAYGQAYNSNENDFAGRGLYNSGLFGKSVNDLNTDYTDRKNTMDTARADWQSTQDLNRNNLQSSQESTRQSALSDAIARIAAQYGVNLSDVTPGRANQVTR